MSPAVWVPLLVVGIALVQAMVWIPIVATLRRRAVQQRADLDAVLARAATDGDSTLCPPTLAQVWRGHRWLRAHIALTSRQLYVRSSPAFEIALAEVKGVRGQAVFRRNFRGGHRWVIVETGDGELGLSLATDDHARWLAALRDAITPA